MQFDIAKLDGIKSDENPMAQARFGPKSDNSAYRILKSKNGIRLHSCKKCS